MGYLKQVLSLIITLSANLSIGQNCYQDYIRENIQNHTVKHIGNFTGKEFYVEILAFQNGGGTCLNFILLKTDSGLINDYDFCFELGSESSISNISKLFDSHTNREYGLDDIKTIYQVLFAEINFACLDNNETKLYLKNGGLFLEYSEGSCISGCPTYHVTEKYVLVNNKFKLTKRKKKRL